MAGERIAEMRAASDSEVGHIAAGGLVEAVEGSVHPEEVEEGSIAVGAVAQELGNGQR